MVDGKIIDTPWYVGGKAGALKAAGVGTVIRYYNFQNSSTFPRKRLTLAEAEELCGAGLQLAAVFQQRQNQIADFSRQKGLRAGKQAFRIAADQVGQPEGSGIYFSVDFDASQAEITAAIQPYFEGVREGMAAEGNGAVGLRVGAYGSGLVCRALVAAGLTELSWISMSRGFRETRDAIAAGDYNLNQIPPATTLLGLGVDYDETNPAKPDFGGFVVEMDQTAAAPGAATSANYVVTARSGLRLRAGAGTGFDIVDTLAFGTTVQVVGTKDDWAKVDREGDGAIDGFAYAAYLRPA
jgi:hypothetical protein